MSLFSTKLVAAKLSVPPNSRYLCFEKLLIQKIKLRLDPQRYHYKTEKSTLDEVRCTMDFLTLRQRVGVALSTPGG